MSQMIFCVTNFLATRLRDCTLGCCDGTCRSYLKELEKGRALQVKPRQQLKTRRESVSHETSSSIRTQNTNQDGRQGQNTGDTQQSYQQGNQAEAEKAASSDNKTGKCLLCNYDTNTSGWRLYDCFFYQQNNLLPHLHINVILFHGDTETLMEVK